MTDRKMDHRSEAMARARIMGLDVDDEMKLTITSFLEKIESRENALYIAEMAVWCVVHLYSGQQMVFKDSLRMKLRDRLIYLNSHKLEELLELTELNKRRIKQIILKYRQNKGKVAL